MNVLLDKDFVMGFASGVGIAIFMKLVKDIVLWIRDRKGKGSLTEAAYKTILKKVAAILLFIKVIKPKPKGFQEVYDIDAAK